MIFAVMTYIAMSYIIVLAMLMYGTISDHELQLVGFIFILSPVFVIPFLAYLFIYCVGSMVIKLNRKVNK